MTRDQEHFDEIPDDSDAKKAADREEFLQDCEEAAIDVLVSLVSSAALNGHDADEFIETVGDLLAGGNYQDRAKERYQALNKRTKQDISFDMVDMAKSLLLRHGK